MQNDAGELRAEPHLPTPAMLPAAQAILLGQLCRQQPTLAIINVSVALVFATCAVFYAAPRMVVAWAVYCVLAQACRVALIWPWRWGRREVASEPTPLRRRLIAGSFLAGFSWGALGWFFIGIEPVILDPFVVFVLAGMAAGAVTALPAYPPAFAAFLLAALLPAALRFGVDPRPHTDVMAFLAVGYAVGIGFLGRFNYRAQLDNASLSLAKEQLVESLQEAGQALESRVAERTRQLQIANEQMAEEIENRRRSEAQVRHLLHHDPLTDLPNRLVFGDRLETALKRARRQGTMVALALFDVDRFKAINDTLGHLTGDALLRAMAGRLAELFRASDTFARLGGDEFAAIFADLDDEEDVDRVATRLMAAMGSPFIIEGRSIPISLSMGIALYPEHGGETVALFSGADLALYEAKLAGRGRYRVLSSATLGLAQARRQLEDDLRGAVDRGEFELVYQPQMSLSQKRIVGAEALVRWSHPRQGLLTPETFIPVAERCGLVREIDHWVIGAACRQAAQWQAAAHPVRLAVNLSPLEFREPGLADRIDRHLRATGLAPDRLEVEITETAYLDRETTRVDEQLRAVKKLGVRIAIDDFGTGYASLSYLRWLPVDAVKIDRSFVSTIADAQHDAAIVASTVALATNLGKTVIAEGVETETQCRMLQDLGCDQMQGFLFGKPGSDEDLRARLGTVH